MKRTCCATTVFTGDKSDGDPVEYDYLKLVLTDSALPGAAYSLITH